MLRAAPHATDAASLLYVATFNASIAVGALIGGLAVETAGVAAVAWIGACLVGLGLTAVLAGRTIDHPAE